MDSSLAFAKQNNLWGVIDQKGKWKIEPKYEVLYFENNLVLIFDSKNNKSSFLDNQGYKQGIDFVDVLFHEDKKSVVLFTETNKYLYLIESQKLIETPVQIQKRESLKKIKGNLFLYEKNGLKNLYLFGKDPLQDYTNIWILDDLNAWGFHKNKDLVSINLSNFSTKKMDNFDNVYAVNETMYNFLFLLEKGNKRGLMNYNGDLILPLEYDKIEKYLGNLYLIGKDNLKGLLNIEAKEIIFPAIYQQIEKTPYTSIFGSSIMFKNDRNLLLLNVFGENINLPFDNITFLVTPPDASNEYDVIVVEKNKKYALLKNKKLETSIYFDKIELVKSLRVRDNAKSDYDLVVFKNKERFYINPENYELSKKPFEVKIKEEVQLALVGKSTYDNEPQENKVYQEFEVYEHAEYEGGINAFRKAVQDNLVYPEKAKVNKTEGNVVLQFTVNKKGNIEDIKILKDIGDECGEAAVEAIKKTNKPWSPAKNRERIPIKVRKTLPIKFKL
ncbi:MAG: TonB family protein [Raineya sp.]|nr:TonB family protein [Raineya sp.]